ncbi:MAG: 5-(carboxyamino)imidazole ribonucleotide synthase [Bacteroidetes bacterium]|nr:5-(carboxyamino)imidazole ribonucleotide synthase [Bacteroidota bacterium]MDA0879212.1 5-(carboxyamino)imidazole ribonucleotide synthase [Bacteroidota bacterium]MDA1116357.1 5-(carboxyamino)imidazole ribonucleotide synthase [Bacteroidota bacterium]
MKYYSSSFTLGILGGGQLGKMLLAETRKMDIATKVLDPSKEAPSRLACNTFVQGDLMDFDTIVQFGQGIDILTIEIENVNADALQALEKQGVKVYPSSQTLRTIQNKCTQKLFFVDHNLPTAPFQRFAYKDEMIHAIENQALNFPFVWKSAQFGYDGNGVKMINSIADTKDLPSGQCIAEMLIDFKMELAVTVARRPSGEVKLFPVVEMDFHPEANQVTYVICPARISEDIVQKAELVAMKAAAAFEHVGLLAVEMFLTHDGEILINEVAPRTHNSGHHTIESSYTSQFEQHLRAVLDLPLGSTEMKTPAVMVNLVGAEGFSGPVYYENIEKVLAQKGVSVHVYGKTETRPFRKMGHCTVVAPTADAALEIAKKVKNQLIVKSE